MNAVDLNHFQFDRDLTWMSFFQNADGYTYARYGGREDAASESHLTKQSLEKTMQRVLKLHDQQQVQPDSDFEPRGLAKLAAYDIPTMRQMMSKRKESCIHCHDIKTSQLRDLAQQGKLEKRMVYTYPSPSTFGLKIDSHDQTLVESVAADSAAAVAGLQNGDRVVSMNGHRTITFGDMTRALELVSIDGGDVDVKFVRGDKLQTARVSLKPNWRATGDPSWRSSTGVVGPSSGFWGFKVKPEDREKLGIADDKLAVRVNFLWGQWTKDAGIKHGDTVVRIGDNTADMTIRQLQAYLQMNFEYGAPVEVEVLRNGKRQSMKMTLPDRPDD
ncbi:MAG: PDZ domain-containing protein [Planctomycetales bacterium]|nr:PDZ domain-containing protein [Planctomycetales bacterium]